jgi:hypothetical protein
MRNKCDCLFDYLNRGGKSDWKHAYDTVLKYHQEKKGGIKKTYAEKCDIDMYFKYLTTHHSTKPSHLKYITNPPIIKPKELKAKVNILTGCNAVAIRRPRY